MKQFKKVLMLLSFLIVIVPMMATLVTIGTGTVTARQPLAYYFGYERSANLYLASEIGMLGNISDLAWYPTISQTFSGPTKIYLKTTTATTLTPDTWANTIIGATLVYDGVVTGFTANTWKVVDINDWILNGGNLIVMVETNYTNAGTGDFMGAAFTQTTMASNMTTILYQDNNIPTGSSSTSLDRPNIQMHITPLSGPALFSMSQTSIDFGQNFVNVTSPAQTVIVSNIGGTTMHINSLVLGGGDPSGFVVTDANAYPYTLASGASMNFAVAFRPTGVHTYNATITVTDDLTRTSHTLSLSGIGFDPSISTFPYSESFDGTPFVPLGWSNYRIQGTGTPGIWDQQTTGDNPSCNPHSGAAMARYYSFLTATGTQAALVSPPLVLPGSNYRVKFWMYRDDGYADPSYNNEMVSVWLSSTPTLVGADSLGVIHRRLDLFPVEPANGWYAYAMNFPVTASGTKFVIFKAISCYGNNMFLDDVTFEQQPTGAPTPAMVTSPANNAIDQYLTTTLNWWPDGTGPAPTGYRLSLGTDNPPTNILNNSNVALTTSYTPTLQYATTYYWKIVPFNATGPAIGCPVWVFTTMADPTVTIFPYIQNFDSVTAPAIPVSWSSFVVPSNIGASVATNTWGPPYSAPNSAYLYNSSDQTSNVVLVSPPTPTLETTRIRFWAKGQTGSTIIVGTVTSPTDPNTFTAYQTVTLTSTYAQYMVSFAGYNGLDHYVGLKHGNHAMWEGIYIDDFTWQLIPTGAQVEVNATGLNYGEIYNNSTSAQSLVITNSGLADLTYTINTSGTTVTTDVTGTQTITPGNSQTMWITIHPIAEGAFTGSITINSNDPQTPSLQIPLTATILPPLAPGLIEVGNGSLVNLSLPVEPFYNYSFSQTIYLQQELNQPNSQIQSIFYKYNGSDEWSDAISIYIGQTTRTEFTSTTDYVPASELTLVYSGQLSVTTTPGWVEIPLQVPFTYDNVSNLVVCVDKDNPPYHSSIDDFFCTSTTTNRSLQQYSDTGNSDVNNPLEGVLETDIPNTRFQFVTLSTTPLFAAIPSTVNFGSVLVDNTSSPTNVQIRNAGGGTLTITQPITLSGVDAAQFSLTDTNTYPHTLNAGQSIIVSLTFTPNGAGVKNAQLNVSDDLVAYKRSAKVSFKDNESDRLTHIVPITGYGNDGIIHTFPYNQGFEDAAFPNAGWTVANGANAANGWRRRTTAENIHNGLAYAVVGTLAGNHWMMTPKFEIGTESNTLRYWIKDSTDTPDTAATSVGEFLKVLISTTNADSSSFVTEIANFTNLDIPITYTQQTIDLTPYMGQNIIICFLRHSTGGKFLYVDDLSIANATGIVLNPPTNLTYSVVSENNVTLDWTAPEPATGTTLNGYKVYRNNLFLHNVPGGTTTDTDQSVPIGTYTYKVSAVYAEGESGFSDPIGVEITGGNPNELISESFEFYPDFAQTFGYWTTIDGDTQNTYNFANATYPNLNSPKSFMVFNPNSTTPPLTSPTAHSGNKLLVCFDSQVPPNNDWFITPRIHLGDDSSVNFWAKSFTGQYGLENFKVAISTTDNSPASFTNVITGGTAVSVPAIAWTQYDYDLSAFDGQFIYLAIRCVSNNAFALLIDDFKLITTNGTATDDPAPLPSGTALLGNYPNPFNPETIIHYTLKDRGNVLIEIFNTRGQKVTTLENTLREPGHYTVNWSGKDQYGKPVTSGVYFYKMKSGTYSSTKKMILLR